MATAAVIVPNIPSGECGDDMTWRIVGKTLTISGTGDMWDRSYIDVSIWNSYRENIDNVVVKSGVTRIGAGAFKNFDSLTSVTLPDSLTSIGGWSFMHCGDLTEITIPSGVMSIDGGAFDYCESLTAVNYSGTESDWNNIEISERGNDYLLAAEITFLSE